MPSIVGDELVEAVEQRLPSAPVVPVGPVAADVLDPGERRALRPVVDRLGVRPAGVPEPVAEVVEHVVGDVDA